jgi:hypothetical protein
LAGRIHLKDPEVPAVIEPNLGLGGKNVKIIAERMYMDIFPPSVFFHFDTPSGFRQCFSLVGFLASAISIYSYCMSLLVFVRSWKPNCEARAFTNSRISAP